jgi:serine/threonine protein kinase
MVTPKTELTIRCDGEALAACVLEPGEYTVGSGPECAVRIERPGLASRHALLTVNYDELFVEPVEDAEVRVNDRPISGYTRLWPHQRVQVGSAILELHRVKSTPGTDESLPPSAHQLARLLPPDLHRDRRYDIGGEIGQGGMGVVLDARDPALRRAVAMKVLLDQHAGDHLLRFIEEAQITGQLEHPNIPPVHELGVDENGKPYYTMKLVRGQTLREVLADLARGDAEAVAKYPLPALRTVFQKVCDAVAFAHEKQIIHRDLKPENIMIGRFGEVLVMDWGLAKVLDPAAADDLARRSAVTSARVEEGEVGHTQSGAVVGTPQYMSPEQAAGEVETLDARTDIYALGAILYHILALRPSVEGSSVASILGKVTRGEVAPLQGAGAPSPRGSANTGRGRPSSLPASLAAVVRKAMALDREQRYQSVPELQRDLTAYQGGFATSAEKAGFWKQATLLVKRHKVAHAAAAIILTLTIGFTAKVLTEGRRAERALTELKKTAPTFAEYARSLIEQQRFDDALNALRSARELDPSNPDYAIQQGHILQTLLRFPEAMDAYRAALRLRPTDAIAQSNLALTQALETERLGEKDGDNTVLAHLHTELLRQERSAEAVGVIKQFAGDARRNYDTWKPILEKVGVRITSPTIYRANKDGTLVVNCRNNAQVADLKPLAGMPLSELDIGYTSVSDLQPLRGMPLIRLNLSGLRELSDLEPLRRLPLRTLTLSYCNISDLSPLRGLPLRSLTVAHCDVSDLSPLRGMALTHLVVELARGKIPDIAALEGMPLEKLQLSRIDLIDARILEPMPLTSLYLSCGTLSDLYFLKGKALTQLKLIGCTIRDVGALAGMPLEYLSLNSCAKVENLDGLRNLPLQTLVLGSCPVSDLSPLEGAPLRLVVLRGCRNVKDLAVLATIPTLEEVVLPPDASPEPLRALPNLKRLSYRVVWDSEGYGQDRPAQTAAEFWAEYDARKAAEKQ